MAERRHAIAGPSSKRFDHASGLCPKADRPHHVFSDSEIDHRLLLINKQLRLLVHPFHGLRKPRIAAWKRFVAGNAIWRRHRGKELEIAQKSSLQSKLGVGKLEHFAR